MTEIRTTSTRATTVEKRCDNTRPTLRTTVEITSTNTNDVTPPSVTRATQTEADGS